MNDRTKNVDDIRDWHNKKAVFDQVRSLFV